MYNSQGDYTYFMYLLLCFTFLFTVFEKEAGAITKKKEFVYKTTSSWKIKGKIFTFVITERKNTEKT